MPSFQFNEIFQEVFFTDKRYIDIWGGRGRGGSHFGTDYYNYLITQPKYFRGYFVRKVLNDIKDSLFQDIKDRINENSTLNIEDYKINEANYSLIYKPTGNKIISKGSTGNGSRPAKMKSLAKATHVLIEEANELSEDEFDQLDDSIRTNQVDNIQIIRIFNPPNKNHWIWRDYNLIDADIKIDGDAEKWYRAEPKSESNILSIFSTYEDNILNINDSSKLKYERYKSTRPKYYFNQIKGLISSNDVGVIYSGWNPIKDDAYNSINSYKVYIIDFGYSNDPNAIIEVKWENYDVYVKELLYESGLDNLALAKKMHDLGIKDTDLVIGDTGNGGDLRIAELRRGFTNIENYPDLRFSMFDAVKGPGSIKFGINRVKSYNIYMTESSVNGWKEYQEYKWSLDGDKNPTDTPIDKYNHIMDAVRYFALAKGVYY